MEEDSTQRIVDCLQPTGILLKPRKPHSLSTRDARFWLFNIKRDNANYDSASGGGMLNMTIFRLTKRKILLLGSAVFPFTNITAAYACTSVVYLFRHAEDEPKGPTSFNSCWRATC